MDEDELERSVSDFRRGTRSLTERKLLQMACWSIEGIAPDNWRTSYEPRATGLPTASASNDQQCPRQEDSWTCTFGLSLALEDSDI